MRRVRGGGQSIVPLDHRPNHFIPNPTLVGTDTKNNRRTIPSQFELPLLSGQLPSLMRRGSVDFWETVPTAIFASGHFTGHFHSQ